MITVGLPQDDIVWHNYFKRRWVSPYAPVATVDDVKIVVDPRLPPSHWFVASRPMDQRDVLWPSEINPYVPRPSDAELYDIALQILKYLKEKAHGNQSDEPAQEG